MGECFYWYRPTQVVLVKQLCVCVCVCARVCVCVCALCFELNVTVCVTDV